MHTQQSNFEFTSPPKWAEKLAEKAANGSGYVKFSDLPIKYYKFFAEFVKPVVHAGKLSMPLKEFAKAVTIYKEQHL